MASFQQTSLKQTSENSELLYTVGVEHTEKSASSSVSKFSLWYVLTHNNNGLNSYLFTASYFSYWTRELHLWFIQEFCSIAMQKTNSSQLKSQSDFQHDEVCSRAFH